MSELQADYCNSGRDLSGGPVAELGDLADQIRGFSPNIPNMVGGTPGYQDLSDQTIAQQVWNFQPAPRNWPPLDYQPGTSSPFATDDTSPVEDGD